MFLRVSTGTIMSILVAPLGRITVHIFAAMGVDQHEPHGVGGILRVKLTLIFIDSRGFHAAEEARAPFILIVLNVVHI